MSSSPHDQTRDKTRFVGLDVHKREITFCILDAQGQSSEHQRFDLNRETLQQFCEQHLRPTD